MADLMQDLKNALGDLTVKKKEFEAASNTVKTASHNYETAKYKVVALRAEVDKSLDEQLGAAGVDLSDSRVHQSE